jgi:Spy/CpxP family protein refolding chaperone
MRHFVLGSLVAVALGSLVLSSVAVAQQPGQGGFGGFGRGTSRTGLLQEEYIQKELELVADQIEKIKTISTESQAETRKLFEGLRDLSDEERRAKFQELQGKMTEAREASAKKVNEVLLPHQKTRLDQLVVQSSMRFGGLGGALSREDIAKTLNITDEQKTKLREATEKANKDAEEKIAKIREEARKQVIADVLTSEQRAQFEKMVGEPFKFPAQTGGFGGRGQGGPGGRGQGGQGGEGGGRRGRGGNNGGGDRGANRAA